MAKRKMGWHRKLWRMISNPLFFVDEKIWIALAIMLLAATMAMGYVVIYHR